MSMDHYLLQLKEDLRESATRAIQAEARVRAVDGHLSPTEQHIAEVERYINGPDEKLSSIVGIEKILLPPALRLNDDQLEEVYAEVESLLAAFHFYPDFPLGLSTQLKYEILRDEWDREVVYVAEGESHLEFCDYDPSKCRYPKAFCRCVGLMDESTGSEQASDSETQPG
jgi:hypothetical protein